MLGSRDPPCRPRPQSHVPYSYMHTPQPAESPSGYYIQHGYMCSVICTPHIHDGGKLTPPRMSHMFLNAVSLGPICTRKQHTSETMYLRRTWRCERSLEGALDVLCTQGEHGRRRGVHPGTWRRHRPPTPTGNGSHYNAACAL